MVFQWPGFVYPGGPYTNYTMNPQWPAYSYGPECMEVIENWDGVEIHTPSMVLIAGIGAMTGMFGFWFINWGFFGGKRLHSDMYRLPFFWFAFMNTTGLICHSIAPAHHSGSNHHGAWPPDSFSEWCAFLDVCFSTLASFSFALAALSDWRILKWERMSTVIFVGLSYGFIVGGYIAEQKGKWHNAWKFLYSDLTKYSSIFYAASTALWLGLRAFEQKKISTFVVPLVTLVIGEGVGLWGLRMYNREVHPNFGPWLCDELGPNFGNTESFWYTCSDTGLIFLLLTFFLSHPVVSDSEEEKLNEHLLETEVTEYRRTDYSVNV